MVFFTPVIVKYYNNYGNNLDITPLQRTYFASRLTFPYIIVVYCSGCFESCLNCETSIIVGFLEGHESMQTKLRFSTLFDSVIQQGYHWAPGLHSWWVCLGKQQNKQESPIPLTALLLIGALANQTTIYTRNWAQTFHIVSIYQLQFGP